MSNASRPHPLAGFPAAKPVRSNIEPLSEWSKGSISSVLTRVNGEPTMLLMRRTLEGRCIAIPQSRLPLYVDEQAGTPLPRLAAKAREIAKLIGMDLLDVNVNDIIDMVMHQADDLRKMKVE